PPFPCNRNSARPLQQTAARAPTLPAPPRSPPALPPHCAPGRRALQCGPPEITPGCESSPGSPDRKLPPCVAPPGALRPSSPHMYAAGGTAARSTAAAPLCRPSRGRWRLVSAVRLPARPPAYRQAAITGRPQLHQHAVDCRVLRGHAQLPRPLGFIGDGLKTEVSGEALLFLANPLLRHGLPIHQVWHSLLARIYEDHNPAQKVGDHNVRPSRRGRLPVQVHRHHVAGILPRANIIGRRKGAVTLAHKDTQRPRFHQADVGNAVPFKSATMTAPGALSASVIAW